MMLKSAFTLAMVAALTAGAMAQSPTPAPPKTDAPKSKALMALQGAWVFTTSNGQDMTGQPEIVLTITDNTYVQTVNGEVVEKGTFKVDDTKKPMQMDIHVVEGKDAGENQLGVYEITTTDKGTTMRGNLTEIGVTVRPTDFTPAQGYFAFTAAKRK
jgi:uncharacterized protein (TIGR03067 family)